MNHLQEKKIPATNTLIQKRLDSKRKERKKTLKKKKKIIKKKKGLIKKRCFISFQPELQIG
jgi:hypothetical protein